MNSPSKNLLLLLGAAACAISGCGGDPFGLGKTAPVSGIIMIGDVPLHTGIVTFLPDAARGNKTPHQPSANIDESGKYALFTVGKAAAPLGWYKVQIMAFETDKDLEKRAKSPGQTGRPTKSLIDPKYEDPKTTPLAIEVVENPVPQAYDFKLSR